MYSALKFALRGFPAAQRGQGAPGAAEQHFADRGRLGWQALSRHRGGVFAGALALVLVGCKAAEPVVGVAASLQVPLRTGSGAAADGSPVSRGDDGLAEEPVLGGAPAVNSEMDETLAVPRAEQQEALEVLLKEFRGQGLELSLEAGWCALNARVLARYQPLEYLLVGPRGQGHESLLGTEVKPSALNAALLLMGAQAGQNARWVELPPDAPDDVVSPNDGQSGPGGGGAEPGPEPVDGAAPSSASGEDDEPSGGAAAGADPSVQEALPRRPRYRIELPSGEGLYLYVGWRAEGEAYFFRVEDLIANVRAERCLRRHRFVYLGSKWVQPKPGAEPAFAADIDQNLINLVFFSAGHTLLTAAVAEAEDEEVWFANPWLLPESDQPVLFVLSKSPISGVPAAIAVQLPQAAFPND
jgi:hypothetical protein